MAIKLTITEECDPTSEFERSFILDRIVIGRSRSADVCLPNMAVSTRHAEIRLMGADFALVDLESLNGSQVNGNRVLPYRNRLLRNGDIIAVANFRIRFQMGVPADPGEERDTAVLQARDLLARILARSGGAVDQQTLYVSVGPSRGARIELPPPPATLLLGRGKHVDLYVDDTDISRQHAEISITPEGVVVRDISRGGLLFEGKRVAEARLEPGRQFTIGSSTLLLEHPAERSLGRIFEAPEENTVPFVPPAEDERAPVSSAPARDGVIEPSAPDATPEAHTPEPGPDTPPIGPKDPLVDPHEASGEISSVDQKPTLPQGKTDIGLIMVGALILAAAVLVLVYLFQ